ncbi:MAG: aminotransferase class I/II-fold pyridoxal phosphate-dependent enzyme [Deltaproteobacteria bacterium]|nr:MAG: aminotransferase class I/II-fold pyridoxal phosphate-dependent enzyme [Deltaproteobacteria bacterium]
MGLSKTFSITGWRIGYTVAPPEMTRAITLVNDLYYVCAPTPLQHGVAAGFAAPDEAYEEMRLAYQRKRDMTCEALDAVGMTPIVPEGAYYILADVRKLGFRKALPAAMTLLERTGVASVPGTAFFRGETGEHLLRFCFAKEDDVLEEACRRIRAFSP